MRKEGPMVLLAIVTLTVIVEYFFKIPAVATASSELKSWGVIIAAFALGLASMNLARVHVTRISRRRKDWWLSMWLLGCTLAFAVGGIAYGAKHPTYAFYYNNLLAPLTTAMQGMTIFFVGSAAFRVFNARNVEAMMLLGAVVITLLANVPIGQMLSKYIPWLATWIMNIPNMAGQRGILITSAIGSIAIGFRIVLGLERSHFGGGE